VSTWDKLSGLELHVEGYGLTGLQASVSSDFERKSTIIALRGAGHEGVGEDVTYDAVDQEILQRAGAVQPLAGHFTLASFCERVAELELFPEPPQREVSGRYRTWAYESAALDLALRQAGSTLYGALAREPAPVRYVVSLRLGVPATIATPASASTIPASTAGRTRRVRIRDQASVNTGVEQTRSVETATLACCSEAIQLPKCTASARPASPKRRSVGSS